MKTATKIRGYIVRTIAISVDETKPLKEMVEDAELTWGNSLVATGSFPKLESKGKVRKKVVLFQFNVGVSSEAAIEEMKHRGYLPATMWDLLGLAAKDPDLQRSLVVAALGSFCEFEGTRYVAFISGFSLSRLLRLYKFNSIWNKSTCFAGIHK